MTMEIRIIHRGEHDITFIVEGVDASFVNALRRVFLGEIPVFAMDYVIFYNNTSPLYDEIISHRLGMVPLTSETDRYIPADQCCEEGCEKCSVTLSLSKEGPCIVLSGDLISEDADVVPVHDNIPIVKLSARQKLTVNAIARMGYGRDHAKWQGALASYQHVPRIEVNTEMCDLGGACIEVCPRNVLDIMDNQLVPKYLYLCNLCNACNDICDYDAITVTPIPDSFIFRLESYGCMSVKPLIDKVVEIFDEKIDNFLEEIKKL